MASNELAIKFSNELYATKKDLVIYLKTSMVDSVWNKVLEYRSNFSLMTKLKHITGSNYSICLTPGINEKVNKVQRKFLSLNSQFLRLNKSAKEYYFKNSYKNILETVSKNYKLNLDEISLNRILSKNLGGINPDLIVLYNYNLSLEFLKNNYVNSYDLNLLKSLESKLQGANVENLRTLNLENSLSRPQINKLYLGIPASSVEKAINDLFLFLNDTNVDSFIKAANALYYSYYSKPFEVYCEEFSILLFKYILGNEGLDELASTLNFESLLDNKDELEENILESQKTLDLTYITYYILNKSEEIIDKALKNIEVAKANDINKEIFQDEEEINRIVPDLNDLNEKVIVTENKNESFALNYNKNIALDNIPEGLSEIEAKRLEDRLLEMNPDLSHGQAYFYARHCTMDMSYTISQYKKAVGCAYETARSSMDKLVRLGYYRKELLKNKFIYKPIKRR